MFFQATIASDSRLISVYFCANVFKIKTFTTLDVYLKLSNIFSTSKHTACRNGTTNCACNACCT